MYIPSTFLEKDPEVISKLIVEHPLGMLFSAGSSGLMFSPIPFLYRVKDGKQVLVAHMAKANPHWKDLLELKECLGVLS